MTNFADAHPGPENSWPWVVRSHRTHWGDLLAHVLIEIVVMTAAVLLILAAGGLAGVYWALPALNAQGREFADGAINDITPHWDESILMSEATPRLLASSYNGYDTYFATLRRLGAGARNEGCVGRTLINPLATVALVTPRFVRAVIPPTPFSELITASYTCELHTSGRTALAALTLRRDTDAWRIASFYVAAPRLARD